MLITKTTEKLAKEKGLYELNLTQEELQKWLREKHDIEAVVFPLLDNSGNKFYSFECLIMYANTKETLSNMFKGEWYFYTPYPTYEEALEDALIEGLNFI